MYEVNICSPIWPSTPASYFNLTVVRLLLLTILLLLYIMFIVLRVIVRKSISNLKSEDSAQRLAQKQLFSNAWQREYMLMLGDHVVALGFVMCFSPYQFETVLAIVHLVLRVGYEVRLHRYNHKIRSIKTVLRVMNLSLLVCALVGLSRTDFDFRLGVCRDPDYRDT